MIVNVGARHLVLSRGDARSESQKLHFGRIHLEHQVVRPQTDCGGDFLPNDGYKYSCHVTVDGSKFSLVLASGTYCVTPHMIYDKDAPNDVQLLIS